MIAGVDFTRHKELILTKSTSKMEELHGDNEEKDRTIKDLENQVNIWKLKYEDVLAKYKAIKRITEEPDSHAITNDSD